MKSENKANCYDNDNKSMTSENDSDNDLNDKIL